MNLCLYRNFYFPQSFLFRQYAHFKNNLLKQHTYISLWLVNFTIVCDQTRLLRQEGLCSALNFWGKLSPWLSPLFTQRLKEFWTQPTDIRVWSAQYYRTVSSNSWPFFSIWPYHYLLSYVVLLLIFIYFILFLPSLQTAFRENRRTSCSSTLFPFVTHLCMPNLCSFFKDQLLCHHPA